MNKGDIIVEMTPFLFEDGETYYFEVRKGYSNSYHYLYVYKKEEVISERKTWWGLGATERTSTYEYKPVNTEYTLVSTTLEAKILKKEIKDAIIANKAVTKIKDWDGFVGDIPNDAKLAMLREAKLNNLGI